MVACGDWTLPGLELFFAELEFEVGAEEQPQRTLKQINETEVAAMPAVIPF